MLEKQKLRAMYGVGERQFRRYFQLATQRKAVTGEELLRLLETRLDTLVLRLGFAQTMRQARQLVTHGHLELDGRRVDLPAISVRPGQTIQATPAARNFISVREALEVTPVAVEDGGDTPERHPIPRRDVETGLAQQRLAVGA